MSGQMKGLNQFIADMRQLRSPDEEQKRVNEELANIRQRFGNDATLSEYDRRKYVAKLLYIYMLGYPVQTGRHEAIELADSPKMPAKQMGYLALSLIYNENDRVTEQATPVVTKDLASLSDMTTSLALGYLGSVRDASEISTSLCENVYKILISPTSNSASKKRAALVLKKMFVLDSSILENSWVERIIALLDSLEVGVALSVASLVKVIAIELPHLCDQVVTIAVRRLDAIHRLKESPTDEIYHGIPVPWLTIKLLELIDVIKQKDMADVLATQLQNTLCYLIEGVCQVTPQDTEASKNTRIAIFMECTNVMAHYVDSKVLGRAAMPVLSKLCKDGSPSVKYMALKTLRQITDIALTTPLLPEILLMVKNRDITIRLQAVETLQRLSCSENVNYITAELLDCLPQAEAAVKSEIVLVLAAIVERYDCGSTWYIDTMLSLLYLGGKHVPRKVSQRIIEMIICSPLATKKHAAKASLEYLQNEACSDNLFVCACVVLGEFGALISHEHKSSNTDQLLALQDSVDHIPVSDQVFLLQACTKIAARSDNQTKSNILDMVSGYRSSPNLAVQDCACELTYLLHPQNQALLSSFCAPLPAIQQEGNELIPIDLPTRTDQVREQVELSRKNTGRRQHPKPAEPEALRASATGKENRSSPRNTTGGSSLLPEAYPSRPAGPLRQISSVSAKSQHSWVGSPISYFPESNGTGSSTLASPVAPPTRTATLVEESKLNSNWEHGFRHLLTNSQGILFQDGLLQVGCQYEFRQDLGCVFLYLRNLSEYTITSINCIIPSMGQNSGISAACKNLPSSTLKPGEVSEVVVLCNVKSIFAVSPTVKISYLVGSFTSLLVKLPLVLERFMEPIDLALEDWLTRWTQVSATGEYTKTFKNFSTSKSRVLIADDSIVAKGLNYGVVKKPALLQNNITYGAGMVKIKHGNLQNYGCLLKIEPSPDRQTIKVTVRATKKTIAVILCKNISDAYQL